MCVGIVSAFCIAFSELSLLFHLFISCFLILGMAKNPKFLVEVSSHFRKDDEIIVVCLQYPKSYRSY